MHENICRWIFRKINQTRVFLGQIYFYEAETLGLAGRCLQMNLWYFEKIFSPVGLSMRICEGGYLEARSARTQKHVVWGQVYVNCSWVLSITIDPCVENHQFLVSKK